MTEEEENEGCETLMHLRPKTAYQKLLWERLKTKTLLEKLKQSELERGALQSELDELKDLMKKDDKGALILKARKSSINNEAKNKKLRDLKKENSELLCIIARHNLKLKENGKNN